MVLSHISCQCSLSNPTILPLLIGCLKILNIFHRSVVLCFWLFLRGICFLYILTLERTGRLPSAFMRHCTGHLHVPSPSPAAIWAYCAEMLRKECLEMSNTLIPSPENWRLLGLCSWVWYFPRVCSVNFSKADVLRLSCSSMEL